MRGLDDKVAIITGGGGGIGGATCKRFGEEGAKVAVWDINMDSAEATASAIAQAGGTAQAFACDIADYAAVQAAVAATESALGPIGVLVNNAGWDVFKPFLKTDPALWEKIIAINLMGAIHTQHAVLPGMAERGAGRVVNVASDAARVGSSGESVYSACKAGIVGLSKTLAREHARQGITFNVVCPGPTQTALLEDVLNESSNPEKLSEAFRRAVPMGRLGQPDDLQGAIAFLASDDASYITGQVISVSGGLTMNG
ncbi:MAG: 2-hydroxycyclohexanecarboxyl-CoA dehydrogenase [Rhodospirillaceae bacterium]|jgi:2-hydroxycyclohexanecarboxyl-CoA dehydrogenase|nr:2-hydroxycyclohexanecarboxyl-CoA dehydrogenase [Rhodospirillaceae bacterium]